MECLIKYIKKASRTESRRESTNLHLSRQHWQARALKHNVFASSAQKLVGGLVCEHTEVSVVNDGQHKHITAAFNKIADLVVCAVSTSLL
jgi:hypothetical protein